MKRTLIIITLIISSLTLTAQEKQNDATWEETISFLKEFLPNFEHSKSTIYPDATNASSSCKYYLKENILISEFRHSYREKVNLKELKSVSIDENSIHLVFSGKIVKRIMNYGKEYEFNLESIDSFYINLLSHENMIDKSKNKYFSRPNSKNTQRLLKAFKQLAYLAKEKRKQSKF